MGKLTIVSGDQILLKYLQIKIDKTGKNKFSIEEILEDFSKIEEAATKRSTRKVEIYNSSAEKLAEDLNLLISTSHASLDKGFVVATPLGQHIARQYGLGPFKEYQEYF